VEEKTVLLTLYSDGSVFMPTATSVGEARAIFAAVARHGEELEAQINGLPLQRPAPPELPVTPE
jgi:hypothetical protein